MKIGPWRNLNTSNAVYLVAERVLPTDPEDALEHARLQRLGGIISGCAYTYSKALRASRAEVIDAVEGADGVDTLALVNGNRGTDHAGTSTNRTRSNDHPDHQGVDRVYIATTPEQFEALAEAVGADVVVQ